MLNEKINSVKFKWKEKIRRILYVCVCMIENMEMYIKAKQLVKNTMHSKK